MNELDFHPAANIFPLMTDAEYAALVSDIAEHGQREAIWLHDGMVLDGRNRLLACNEIGLVPEFREYTGDDPQAFVVSLNLHRRHLTREQRDEVIRQLRTNGMTLQKIAAAVGVSVGKVHSVAGDLIFNSEIENERGQLRPMHYAARAVELEPEEEDEPDIYDLNIWCSGCIHCRTVDSDQDLDFCKKYDKTIYPIGSMYGDLYGDAGQAATCPEYREEPESEPEPIRLYPIVAANHAETEGDDWCTPIEYVDAVREVLGAIDLDPATNEYGQSIIGAAKFYTKQDDGLAHEWHGRVFLNPPYSVPMIDKFASKLLAEYMTGNVTEAIVLTNNSTETQWFQGLLSVCQVVCFPSRRLKFWKNGNEVFATRQGQAFFYFGTSDKFAKVFASFGTVLGKYDDQ